MPSTEMRTPLRPRPLWLVAAAGLLVAACATEQPVVDRVQPNLVDKAMFEGEWWASSTVIDATYDASYTATLRGATAPFSGSMSADLGLDFNRLGASAFSQVGSLPIGRIRWVIEEDFLFAFRTFELTAGGNDDGRSASFRGQPLAVFAIDAHVDVQRDYNPVTGETTNVRSENTSDRRWFDREFMRVDWSRNLVTDFAVNEASGNGLFDAFQRESTSFFVQEGSRDDLPESYAPQFVRVSEDAEYRFADEWQDAQADGEDPVHYMSFVTREVWSPGAACSVCSSVSTTLRHSFLRVPPGHEYAAETMSNREYERFGIIRSRQPTYARGGQDREVLREYCASDADCKGGGSCDTERNICVGGLTEDRGETDFLSQYMSRHNFYSDSLTDIECVADWECDGRNESCEGADDMAACESALRARDGSRCDPAARLCTVPIRSRPTRAVNFTLTKRFPPYLVRRAFDAVGQWNLGLMQGQRAAAGRLAIDQVLCEDDPDSACPCDENPSGVCTTSLKRDVRVRCQDEDPTKYCHCDAPETTLGTCSFRYDPFATPDELRELGLPDPYDCHIEGPADADGPQAYEDYAPEEAYGYRFVGDECLLTLSANACDLDADAPCQELGDLRFQFLNFIDRGLVPFAGVSMPLSDPHNGELIVANAAVTAETFENVSTTTSQLFPVLTGDASEDEYFTGENLRGYFARLGRVERPIATVTNDGDGSVLDDLSRPPGDGIDPARAAESSVAAGTPDLLAELSSRMEAMAPQLELLRGQDGRAAILSDRADRLLSESPALATLTGALEAAGDEYAAAGAAGLMSLPSGQTVRVDASGAQSPPAGAAGALGSVTAPMDAILEDRERLSRMAANFQDVAPKALFESQYWRFWADRFSDRSPGETAIRMRQAVFSSIMAHEIGHSLGLQHNFAASLDRDHYHDGYYNIARQTPLPDYTAYDAAELGGDDDGSVGGAESQRWAEDLKAARETRLMAGAGNVMSSSVMDYPGDLSDLSGVGHYDRAAVLFSYFNLVEAYETGDPRVDPEGDEIDLQSLSLAGLEYADSYRRDLWSYYRGGETCAQDSDCPFSAGKETAVFQPLTQRCITNPRELSAQRGCDGEGTCVCSSFYDDFEAYQNAAAYRRQGEPARYSPVEYLYCDNARINDLSWCTTFDAGESFLEVVSHYRTNWLQLYPRQYFRNFRQSGPAMGFTQLSVPDAVKIYQHLFFRLGFEPEFRTNTGPLGVVDQQLASADVFNWLTEILAAPDVGSYALDADNVYRQISPDPDASGADLSLSPGQGFYLWSEYQEGLNGFFRLERAGMFTDKLLALIAITQRDWRLNFTVDERYFVNFYDFFPREVIDVFGGMILNRPTHYAPRVTFEDGEPKLHYLSNLRLGDRGSNAQTFTEPAVAGVDSLALRSLSLLLALANFPVYYDTSFEQRLLVFKLGSGDGYRIPETLADGTPVCAYGDDACGTPSYIVYESDRLRTSYVAVTIDTNGGVTDPTADEQQLGYQLLLQLTERQDRIRSLSAMDDPSEAERTELSRLRREQEADEGFAEVLIELGRRLGISSIFF